MDSGWILSGGTLLDGGAERTDDLILAGGKIAEDAPRARRFDATGLILAPGLCDAHGDGFERNLSPRPGVMFPADVALIETDRQLVANGITSAWLALTISWEPGLRGTEMAGRIIDALDRLRPHLGCDIRVQLRWEVFAHDAVPAIERWLTMHPRPVLAFNDHLTGLLQGDRQLRKLAETSARAGLSPDAYMGLIHSVADRADEVPANVARLADAAARADVTCFAHDESDAETRRRNRANGITVSEFPLSADAAREAIDAGEATILGAPNVLRGGTLLGAGL